MKTSGEIERKILKLLHASMMTDMTYNELEANVGPSSNFNATINNMNGTLVKMYSRDNTMYVTITLAGMAEHHRMKVRMP